MVRKDQALVSCRAMMTLYQLHAKPRFLTSKNALLSPAKWNEPITPDAKKRTQVKCAGGKLLYLFLRGFA
jgi:hypothetical protein